MSDRMDMRPVSSFTGTLIQADRLSASLDLALRAQASQRPVRNASCARRRSRSKRR